MQALTHSRWGLTLILVGLVTVLALTGGTWGTSSAARAHAPEAVPTLTAIDPVVKVYGADDFTMTLTGTNFIDADFTGVRFYQWGTTVFWEFNKNNGYMTAISENSITITVPSFFVLYPNRFSVVVVNYTDPIIESVPDTIPTVPSTQGNPSIPPTINPQPWESISAPQIFNVTGHLIYLPVVMNNSIP